MARDTRSILPGSQISSPYALRLAQIMFPDIADINASIQGMQFEPLKVVDFTLSAGTLQGRIGNSTTETVGMRARCNLLADEQWSALSELLSGSAYYASQLLAGKLPIDIADFADNHDIALIPRSAIALSIDSQEVSHLTPESAAFFIRLGMLLDEEPCAFLQFRGKTAQELISELRKLRLTQTAERRRPTAITSLNYPDSPNPLHSPEQFWSMGPEIRDLQYSIRADELPASLLKWLAPMPLGGLEDSIDFVMEDAYARVARLAQSFGLGL